MLSSEFCENFWTNPSLIIELGQCTKYWNAACCFLDVTSEQSDIARRIQSLTEVLHQRKSEADALRRQQRDQQKKKLKAKEDSLRRQIEVKLATMMRIEVKLATMMYSQLHFACC